jgi:cytoskeletal protein CcmA (bactofilin family)
MHHRRSAACSIDLSILEDLLMALWKETPAPAPAPAKPVAEPHKAPLAPTDSDAARRMVSNGSAPTPAAAETVIAAGLNMEGKIASGGDVRIAGRFKGDVCVDGNFRIDSAGRLEGQVTASGVVIGGELQGNIDAAKHVELLTTGVIVGDVKATSLTVAAGCRMRGHVEFGWDDRDTKRTARQA